MSEGTEGQEAPPQELTVEDQAREMGWRPREEYEGDEKKWVSAEIFVSRAPLFQKIDETTRHNKALERRLNQTEESLKQLAEHHRKVAENEYNRALATLKAQKKEALADGDLVGAESIQETIEETKQRREMEKLAEAPIPKANDGPPPEFVEWIEENKWYAQDADLKEHADAIGLLEAQKGKSGADLLNAVADKIKKAFPEKFKTGNPMRKQPAQVETQGAGAPGNRKTTSGWKPTEEQALVAKRFAASGVMTVEEYYKQLQELEKE